MLVEINNRRREENSWHILIQNKLCVWEGVGKEQISFVIKINQLLVFFTYQIYKI